MNLPKTCPEVLDAVSRTHEVLDITLLHLFSPAKLLSIHEVQLYQDLLHRILTFYPIS